MSEHTPAPNTVERDTDDSQNNRPNDPALDPKPDDAGDPTTPEGNRFSPDFKSDPEVDPGSADDEETDADIDTAGG
ncbi:hypothetical protein AHFPHNDE_02261 [Pseudomonas sp. MM227]|uniref:hypothetical protein n=1 Tax=Pseudomonas sp. MM227 TaxID=3019968 RepID=UPI000F024FAF|nr:hypothetical protein [Pseudomonas sp. MM227]CAI3788584.1 hypothetical protein AHFPHNDE_02261 [Pseudomonas sp. MM227]